MADDAKKVIYDLAIKNLALINASLDNCRLFLSPSTGLIDLRGDAVNAALKSYPTEELKCLVLSDENFIKEVLFKNLSARSQPLGMYFEQNKINYKGKQYAFKDISENAGCSIFNGTAKTIKGMSGPHKIQCGQRSYEPPREEVKNIVFFESGDYFIMGPPPADDADEFINAAAAGNADRFRLCPYKLMKKGTSADHRYSHVIHPTRFEVLFNNYSQLCVLIGAYVYTFRSGTVHHETDDYNIVRINENECVYIVQSIQDDSTYWDYLTLVYHDMRSNRYGEVHKWECFPYIGKGQTITFHGAQLTNEGEDSWIALFASKNGDVYALTVNGYILVGQFTLPRQLREREIGQIPQFGIYNY